MGRTWHDWAMMTDVVVTDSVFNGSTYTHKRYSGIVKDLRALPSTPTCLITANAFLYADFTSNWGLACRASQLLVSRSPQE